MAKNEPNRDAVLTIRYAEAELALKALDKLLPEDKKGITYETLTRKFKIIRDYWLKLERDRKAQKSSLIARRSNLAKR